MFYVTDIYVLFISCQMLTGGGEETEGERVIMSSLKSWRQTENDVTEKCHTKVSVLKQHDYS